MRQDCIYQPHSFLLPSTMAEKSKNQQQPQHGSCLASWLPDVNFTALDGS